MKHVYLALLLILTFSGVTYSGIVSNKEMIRENSEPGYTESGLQLPKYMSADEINEQHKYSEQLRYGGGRAIIVGGFLIPSGIILGFTGVALEEDGVVKPLLWSGVSLVTGGIISIICGKYMIEKGFRIYKTYDTFTLIPILDPFSQRYGTEITFQF